MRQLRWVLAGCLALVVWGLAAPLLPAACTVQTVEGKEFQGDLQDITADGKLHLRDASGISVDLATSNIVEIFLTGTVPAVPAQGWKITLPNGDYLLGAIVTGNDEAISLHCRLGGTRSLNFEHIVEIRVIQNMSREELFQPAQARGETDVTKLMTEDTPYAGTIQQMDASTLKIQTTLFPDGISIPWDRILWTTLAALGDAPPPESGMIAVLKGVDGSRLSGQLQGLRDGNVQLQIGKESLTIALGDIASISFANGAFTYLSDLTPTDVHQDYIFDDSMLKFDWQRDTTVSGNPLTLRGKVYRKGLGAHANNRLTYDIGGQFKRFRAEIGIDDEVADLNTRHLAAVLFKVTLDGKELYVSPTLTLSSAVQKLDLDVKGGHTLVLEVADTNGLVTQDRADWAGAFLLK